MEIVPDDVANKFRLNSQNLSNDSNLSKFKNTIIELDDKVKEINYYRNQRKKLSSARSFDTDLDIVSYFNDGGQYLYYCLQRRIRYKHYYFELDLNI